MSDHFYKQLNERDVDIENVKETIENPDSETSDKDDEHGKIYWKWFKGYHLKVYLRHKRRIPLAKTVYKILDD